MCTGTVHVYIVMYFYYLHMCTPGTVIPVLVQTSTWTSTGRRWHTIHDRLTLSTATTLCAMYCMYVNSVMCGLYVLFKNLCSKSVYTHTCTCMCIHEASHTYINQYMYVCHVCAGTCTHAQYMFSQFPMTAPHPWQRDSTVSCFNDRTNTTKAMLSSAYK